MTKKCPECGAKIKKPKKAKKKPCKWCGSNKHTSAQPSKACIRYLKSEIKRLNRMLDKYYYGQPPPSESDKRMHILAMDKEAGVGIGRSGK